MRGTTARRAALALTACAALLLTGTTSAAADEDEAHGRGPDKRTTSDHRSDDREERAARTTGDRDDESAKTAAASSGDSRSAGADRSGSKQDPRGNNGTIKIDGPAYDVANGNEPHVTCEFAVRFFGFDADQHADIRVTGQAPTGAGTLLAERKSVLVSTDAAGGGKDVDETITFTTDQLALGGITPHPKQGYHIKVAADVLEAPGGAKSKVLWLEPCVSAATATPNPATVGGEGSTGTLETGEKSLIGTDIATATATATGAPIVKGVVTSRSASEAALADAATGAVGAADADVRSAAATRGRGGLLPFTGAGSVIALVLLAAVLIVAGTGALAASRRRRSSEV